MEQYGGGIEQVATTVTAAGTTTLINTSHQIQVFTGTTTQTVVLPNMTTFTKPGSKFEFYNRSTVAITIQYQDHSSLQTIPASAVLIIKCIDNTTANGVWTTLSDSAVPSFSPPTVQKFLSGSGTYTTPTFPSPSYLRVRLVGGGGGGAAGSQTSPGNPGVNGGNTTFGSSFLIANGGLGGDPGDASNAGTGGTASFTAPAIGNSWNGMAGMGGQKINAGSTGVGVLSGNGGVSPFGGAGAGVSNGDTEVFANKTAAANSGSGGAGGQASGAGGAGIDISGGGGGAGGYVDVLIPIPSASYTYSIGTSGTGGVHSGNGTDGGAGGAGIIIIEEHYQ